MAVDHHRVQVADILGIRYLAELLTHPGQPIRALDLVGACNAVAEVSRHELLDDGARTAYPTRARELADDLAEAEANADIGRAEQLRVEMDALVDQLESATGLGQRPRLFTDPNERARTAVRKALSRAIDQIEESDRELGEMLRMAVTTGAECTYWPDPRSPFLWSA